MRKRLTISESPSVSEAWLNLERAATLEITSEDKRHPLSKLCFRRDIGKGGVAPNVGVVTLRVHHEIVDR